MEIEVMKLGINGTGLVQKASVTTVIANAQQAAADGFSHYWLAEHPTGGFDAMTTLALVGAAVPDIEVGTAIVPTFPRHPKRRFQRWWQRLGPRLLKSQANWRTG